MKDSLWLVALPLLISGSAAQAQSCEFFDTQEDFLAILGPQRQTQNFDTAPVSQIDGDEFAASGFVFDSPLAAPSGQLEIAPSDFFWGSRYLNIDSRPFSGGDELSDSLEIYVQGTWLAIGFEIVDGSVLPPAESVEVFDAVGNLICESPPGDNLNYVGIRSTVPIGAVVVNEAFADADDIGYDNFVLGFPGLFGDGFESGNLSAWNG